MKLSEYDKCPKCGCVGTVFAEHNCSNESHRIHCIHCGLSTGNYDTYKIANKVWNEMKSRWEQNKCVSLL